MKRAFRPLDQLPRSPQRLQQIALLTETEAARHCKYFDRGCVNPVRAFQQVARRLGIPTKNIGRTRLYDPAVLDAFMERESWTRRHKPTVTARLSLVNGKSLSGKGVAR